MCSILISPFSPSISNPLFSLYLLSTFFHFIFLSLRLSPFTHFPLYFLISSGMSSEHIEVRRLVDSIAKLMKPLLNRPTALPAPSSTAAVTAPSTPEVAVVRQWQQGKGVVVLEDSLASNGQAEKKVEKKKEDRLLSMLRDAPKPEKIGMALFGLQVRLSPSYFSFYFLFLLIACLPSHAMLLSSSYIKPFLRSINSNNLHYTASLHNTVTL